jgi:hypothetical protein
MKGTLTMPQSPLIRCALTVVVALVFCNASGYAQTTPAARQLLDSMIAALGGKQFLDVTEIQTSGRFFTFKRSQVSASDLFVDHIKFPDRERLEFGKEKEKSIEIHRGLEGWMVTPPKGKGEPEVADMSVVQTEEFLRNFRTSFDYVVRFVVNTPKASVLSPGSESVDSRRADVLEVRDADKNLMRIFIDRATRLPVKMQTRLSNEPILHEEIYANWHKFDGVMTPLMVVRYKDGDKTIEIRAEKAAYNVGFADSLFAPPAPKSK